MYHSLNIGGSSGPAWSFNGNFDRPTFQPSILASYGHFAKHWEKGEPCWCTYFEENPDEERDGFECGICHSFVTDGKIQFLGDCTHILAGKTVDLPEIEA